MSDRPAVAYFSMEYGIRSDVKTYAGGLGILAGDYLKGAKDHGFPIVGVGLKWKQGYTDQYVDTDGRVFDRHSNYEYECMEDTGTTVTVDIRSRQVKCRVWRWTGVEVDRFYLLDTDIDGNHGDDRWITGQLYGWFGEERVAQEMVLGIGGIRALRALGESVDIYHFNEGHALFAGFELVREKTAAGVDLSDACEQTRKEVVFTTHTPIVAGNESHPIDRLIFMGANLGMSAEQLISIGGDPFNMTVGALRLSKITNAVAQLHGETSNNMWSDVSGRSEIIAITNAIHLPTWVDDRIDVNISDDELRNVHLQNKRKLIEFIETRNRVRLDESKLLVGFSRRAAQYKRSDLIFSNPDDIDPLLDNSTIQIVFSGRAHPFDDGGKRIVESLYEKSRRYPSSVVFLENYDMEIGALLTRGADVWLNNPRRPREASGTSGMKAAMNGVLNVSILDGWWPEACRHGENGWQFGDAFESDNEWDLDQHDSEALNRCLLDEVIPTFYDDRSRWISMMKSSIATTRTRFAVLRMLEEYFDRLYCV